MTKALAVAWLSVVCFSALGWGGLTLGLLEDRRPVSRPVTLGVGFACLVFVGGVANLIRLSGRLVLWVLLAAGCGAAYRRFVRGFVVEGRNRPRTMPALGADRWCACVAVACAIAWAIATQLPPRIFNLHDDFEKYFAHPVRMLATGTLAGSPASALGFETLGGLAFLQGLLLAVLPLPDIAALDALAGLFLLALVVLAGAQRRALNVPLATLSALALLAVHPQSVNVSGTYLGAALLATAAALVGGEGEDLPSALLVGLVGAAAISIKTSFGAFLALQIPVSGLALLASGQPRRRVLGWAFRSSAWTAVFASPWVLLHLPAYAHRWSFAPDPVQATAGLSLFSVQPLFYGASVAAYTSLAGLAAFAAARAGQALLRPLDSAARRRAAGALSGAVPALALFFLLVGPGAAQAGRDTALRHAIPFLLSGSFLPVLLVSGQSDGRRGKLLDSASAVGCLAVLAFFAPSFAARVRQARDTGTTLSIGQLARTRGYAAYNELALSPAQRDRIREVQALVPEGAALVAWIGQPFDLDFARNRIVDVEPAGLSTPWARIPTEARFVLWQYAGPPVRVRAQLEPYLRGAGAHDRAQALHTLAFLDRMERLASRGVRLRDDGRLLLFRLADGDTF